ncbi:sugar phosphate isomerase/epimerase family protein [Sphingomonas profundi]|uniref:sugar phosphate isomerase/epimerase family protein n=1 Tax=Alterirhizorhabdus profundi TaxID=2681549 RepID=UPI0012E7BA1E|nr:sugar phosphate isomerase/epimerase [Sphingomonas profundi]
MGAPPALIASYFTLAGAVRPLEGSMVSPVPLARRAEAAAAGGYQGIGLLQEDIAAMLPAGGHAGIAAILRANGLFCEIEVLGDWFTDGARRVAADAERRAILASAEALEAVHVKVTGTLDGTQWPLPQVIESFAGLCDDARAAGTAITIEVMPETSIPDVATGRAIVAGAGRANGGLLIDSFHMTRGAIPFAEIAALAPGIVNHVELDDGRLEQVGSYLEDTIDRRALCGEGEFDLDGFLQAIAATGYAGRYGVEILSHAHRALSVEEAARASCAAARGSLARALG